MPRGSRIDQGLISGVRGADAQDAVEAEALPGVLVGDHHEMPDLASSVRLAEEGDLVAELGVGGGGDDVGAVSGFLHFSFLSALLPWAAGDWFISLPDNKIPPIKCIVN